MYCVGFIMLVEHMAVLMIVSQKKSHSFLCKMFDKIQELLFKIFLCIYLKLTNNYFSLLYYCNKP